MRGKPPIRISRFACQGFGSALRGRLRQQRGGLDLIERAMDDDVAPRLADPVPGPRRSWKAHGLGERLVDIAADQFLPSACVARLRIDRWPFRRMDFYQLAELAAEIGPPAILGASAPEVSA